MIPFDFRIFVLHQAMTTRFVASRCCLDSSFNLEKFLFKHIKTYCWWFGTFGLFFHILGMSSSQLTFIFFRGVGIPPTIFRASFFTIPSLFFAQKIQHNPPEECSSCGVFASVVSVAFRHRGKQDLGSLLRKVDPTITTQRAPWIPSGFLGWIPLI